MRQLGGLVMALCLVSACSFIGVRGPGSRGMECTVNRTAPAVDTVVAVGAAVGTAAAYISASKHCQDNGGEPHFCGQKLVGGIALLIAIPYSFSALYGHTTVSSCRRFRSSAT
jgi:hypothetical protein